MPTEDVVILADGEEHPFVKSLDITLAAEKGVRSATLTTAEPDGRFWLPPGLPVTILASDEPILTGFVRDYRPASGKERHEIAVTVESKTCDLAECAVIHPTGRVEKKDLKAAMEEYGRGFAARFRAEGDLEKIPEMVLEPGETHFALAERYARSQGLYVTDDENGDQVLFKGIRGRHAGVLAYPGNVTDATASLSDRSRKSETRVRGQASRGRGKAMFRSEAVVRDKGVKRHRPHLVIHEGDADAQRLKARAAYDQDRATGLSASATVQLPHWRDDAGKIWTPGFLVPFDAYERLRIAQDMAINAVRLGWNKERGTAATLELRDPKSFASKDKGAGRSDPAWDGPDDDGEVQVEE